MLAKNITHLLEAEPILRPYTGAYSKEDLLHALQTQTNAPTTRLPKNILHIISGNTPHAAYQSLLNGILLGAHNNLKLPSQSLQNLTIPPSLQAYVTTSRTLPPHWLTEADAVIAYGNDTTIRQLQQQTPLHTPFIGHGHRIGIAIIHDPTPEAAALAAIDIGQYDQQGCLSLQTIYLKDPLNFGPHLAKAMSEYQQKHPRRPLGPSEAGAITNLRHETQYQIAQDPQNNHLWHSPNTTDWTIIYQNTPRLTPSPGHRTIYLRPLPDSYPNLPDTEHLSGIGIYPFIPKHLHPDLPSPRLHALGTAQNPPALWAHDGQLPLASLLKHQTCTSME